MPDADLARMATRRVGSRQRAAKAGRALLLIDLINTWQMDDGGDVLRGTLAIVPRVVRLTARAASAQGARVIDALHPGAADHFVLKPRRSAFFATPASIRLRWR